jgi:CTP:molybdopterin cytidylyltransferase MocA
MSQPSYCGLILAAGSSSRMGRDKALLPWPAGSSTGTFLSRAMDVLGPTTDRLIVVAGANEASLRGTVFARAGYLVVNPDPARGQFSSLRLGLQAVLDSGNDGAVVVLVDRPPVKRATIERLQQAFAELSEEDVWAVKPSYGGVHGHPLVMARDMIEALLRAPAESNARDVLTLKADHVRYVEVDDANVIRNVNTPEEYEQAVQSLTGESA